MIGCRQLTGLVGLVMLASACGARAAADPTRLHTTHQSAPAVISSPAKSPKPHQPLDRFLDLEVSPIPVWSSSCEGTVWAGERLHVSAQGFRPRTGVSIYSSSPGQRSIEQRIGAARADSKGAISATVTVPSDATGFRPRGTGTSLTFLDAIGFGPGGTHADASSMLGLAPVGSPCTLH